MTREQIKELPKLDLHCHLDGSLALHSVKKLLGRDVELSELQVSRDCRNLAEYLEKFDLPLACLQTAEGLREASRDFLLEAAKENIVYMETRFAPLLSVNANLNCGQVMEAVLAGLEEGKKACGVEYNIIACAMRHHTPEQNLGMFKAAEKVLGKGLCALDLAGNEAAFPMCDFVEQFSEARRMGFPFTLHAGECGSEENIVDSIESGASRIGHGIAMRGNSKVQELCLKNKIGIEMCPISNLQTKSVPDKSEYPLREFLDKGLLVTLNTDNRTVSNTTVTDEMEFVQREYGVTDEELYKVTRNAIEVAFASEEVKQRVRAKVEKAWEKAWNK